jgi:predicted fused transcriptional regulator/phosphomethylpyrimidine kinase
MEDKPSIILNEAVRSLVNIDRIEDYIPQVGTNIVFAKTGSQNIDDVVGLTGRIISTRKGPLACGKIAYGASQNLASVVIAAQKLNGKIRAAINIKANEDVSRRLKKLGLVSIRIPSRVARDGCPVTQYIKKNQMLVEAFIHPGAFGVEPTTTIIAEDPSKLLELIAELIDLD